MAGFQKAKPLQAAIKLGIYGPSGSGKTFTSLLIAEGLAKTTGKRVALVDTEHGSDFYAGSAPRPVHPEAFDFDAIYTRSITEILAACKKLDAKEYGVLILDSMTHIWEGCIAAYSGKKTSIGSIPMHAWGKIKAPYKELMQFALSSQMHVIFAGRQGHEYGEDNGELIHLGYKMKAEGETPYEPHILLRLEPQRKKGAGDSIVTALVEKDRTGVLQGQVIKWPNFDNVAKPVLSLLGDKQATIDSDADTARDVEAMTEAEHKKSVESEKLYREFTAKFELATDQKGLDSVSKELTAAVKKKMLAEHVSQLRDAYHANSNRLAVS